MGHPRRHYRGRGRRPEVIHIKEAVILFFWITASFLLLLCPQLLSKSITIHTELRGARQDLLKMNAENQLNMAGYEAGHGASI